MKEFLIQLINSQAFATFLGGVLATLGGALATWWQSRSEEKKLIKKTKYLALSLSLLFEKYAETCQDDYFEHKNWDSSDGQIGRLSKRLPELPALTDNENYENLESNLMYKVLAFPHLVETKNISFATMWDYVDGQECVDELGKELLVTMRQAIEIAQCLRKEYGFPAIEFEDIKE